MNVLADISYDGALVTLAWSAVGAALLGVGFAVLDVFTPGRLLHVIRHDRNPNAAALAVAEIIAVAIILVVAAVTSTGDGMRGLWSASGYAAIGIGVQALVMAIYGQARKGSLEDLFADPRLNPFAVVLSTFVVSLGAVLAAAIS